MRCTTIHALSGACMLSGAHAHLLGPGQPSGGQHSVQPRDTGVFDIPRIPNPNHTRNGTAALHHAFAKHGWPLTTTDGSDTHDHAAVPAGTAQVPALPQPHSSEFLSAVEIGTPPQTLHLDLDTGSADLWAFSGLQPAAQLAGRARVFRAARSSSFVELPGASWSIGYGDGTGASGAVGTDVVSVGGAAVAGQAVELARTASAGLVADGASDGILGLAFANIGSIQPTPRQTLFDGLKPRLAAPLFAADLRADGSGAYRFGAADGAPGPLTVVPVDPSAGFWQFASPAFSIDGRVTRRQGSPAIADTGTSLLLGDPPVASAYYAAVSGSFYSNGMYSFPCSAQLPSFGVAIGDPQAGGKIAEIPSRLMSYASEEGTPNCVGSVQSNGGNEIQVIGDVFFRAAYAVFYGDIGKPRFGFAMKPNAS